MPRQLNALPDGTVKRCQCTFREVEPFLHLGELRSQSINFLPKEHHVPNGQPRSSDISSRRGLLLQRRL
jgi:hypothetical protein